MISLVRWLKFNTVGIAGALLQICFLHLLLRANVQYLAATAVAVEAAVLHNFAWHQHYTWVDRPCEDLRSVVGRLLRFHLSNGAVSLIGNILLMRWLTGYLLLNPLRANLIAISVCSVVNYFLGDRFVFRTGERVSASENRDHDFRGRGDFRQETPEIS